MRGASGSRAPEGVDDRVFGIVEEVLGQVLSPRTMSHVLDEALEASGRTEVPSVPEDVRRFVDGALVSALATRLEVKDALELATQIHAALRVALAHGPPEAGPPISGLRRPMRHPGARRRVLCASRASLVLFLLQEVLGEQVDVIPTTDRSALKKELSARDEPVVVLVDRKYPCADQDVTAMNRLLREVPVGSLILLWAATADEVEALRFDLGDRAQVSAAGEDVPLADLGQLCRALLAGA